MEIEKGNLELLFIKIPYYKITVKRAVAQKRHDYRKVEKELYLQYAQSVFPCYSQDERYNNYRKLLQDMKGEEVEEPSIFRMIMGIAGRLLVYDEDEIKCRFDEMLRWREISFQMGQDFFTCAFLADHDLKWGYQTRNFSWLPIIRSDDRRLHNILRRGMAENHFHLAGSTKIFELNWICLMNLIEGRIHDFKKLPSALQIHHMDRVKSEGKKESFYGECQRAALYRVYLFAVLEENGWMIRRAEAILQSAEQEGPIERLVAQIQDLIVLAKHIYGARVDGKYVLDYAFGMDMQDSNDRACYLLAGERRLLYECYKASVTDLFTEYQKNLFYVYLSIRTHFRGELIQVNRQVGFANFSDYQDRKEIFIEGEQAYEDELVRLALNETMRRQNIVSLEARICPKQSASKLYQAIGRNQKIAAQQSGNKNQEDRFEKKEEKIIYVLHFPKLKDKKFCAGSPRNSNVRETTRKQVQSITALLEQGTSINGLIRGIDACSSEINCRPEVFAQAFRYLSGLEFECKKSTGDFKGQLALRAKLHTTYHAGEDFLDIVDGVRAMDEAILFCGLKRGSRIGHGLAMGIDPYQYYKYKNYTVILPKQVLLDDIAWLINKADETGCAIESRLRTELMERYHSLYDEIYRDNVQNRDKASVMDYYQSWKLRGDNPCLYRLEEEKFLQRLQQTPFSRFDRYGFNSSVSDGLRRTECYRNLYFAYHYNEKVREIGDQRTEFKADQRYADVVCQLQDNMIRQLVQKGIGIETNPSSNYLIGTIKKYEEHPILRFNGRKLKSTDKNMSLNVSINTDDQGVFDTLLENEYALMALALRKAKDENHKPLYDIEDIYEWIDYVRKMGIEQIFE